MDPVRLGIVKFLNTVPLVEGLDKNPEISLIPAPPARLSNMLTDRSCDIALVSVIDAALSTVPLALLSCGMIGCDGATLTVRVFSSVPFAQLQTLHVDTESHTSIALARIIFHRAFDRRLSTVPFESSKPHSTSDDWPEAILLIGDKVITSSPPLNRYPHQLDLGEAWKELTGLPFVYALWMCRASDLENPDSRAAIGMGESILDRQLRHNFTRLDRIIQDRAPEFKWPPDLARRYLGELLRYRVGVGEREAVAKFFDEAVAADIITPEQAARVRWA
ncbi:MAG: menaquinone biosynthesis protein [Phycisphaeraceae bacterium]|nr:menaquinone biosynthesis protein [Phycisphaeraceae bacterium]